MRISLFTTTHNNESTIKDFVAFYRDRVPEISITIYDQNSYDKTIEIAKELNCTIKHFYDFYTSMDIFKNECWKYIPTECVVLCEIDEYIELSPDLFKNCSLVKTKGYDVESLTNLNEEKRNTDLDKFCIFDPAVIKYMNYEGNSCNPQGYIKVGEKQPNLYHLIKPE